MLSALSEVLPDRTLILPLARSVLQLNRLEGGRPSEKSEKVSCDSEEVGDGEHCSPGGSRRSIMLDSVKDTTTVCGSFSRTSSLSSGTEWRWKRDAGTEFSSLCCPPESRWGVFCWGVVSLMVDDVGAAGSGRWGRIKGEHLPAIKPSLCRCFPLLPELGWNKPSTKAKMKHF